MFEQNQRVAFISENGVYLEGEIVEHNDQAARVSCASGLHIVELTKLLTPRLSEEEMAKRSKSIDNDPSIDDEVVPVLDSINDMSGSMGKRRVTINDLKKIKCVSIDRTITDCIRHFDDGSFTIEAWLPPIAPPINPQPVTLKSSPIDSEEQWTHFQLKRNSSNDTELKPQLESDVVKKDYIDNIILKSINSGLNLDPIQEDGNRYGWISNEKGNRQRVLVSTPTNHKSMYDSKHTPDVACAVTPMTFKNNFDAYLENIPSKSTLVLNTKPDSFISFEQHVDLQYGNYCLRISNTRILVKTLDANDWTIVTKFILHDNRDRSDVTIMEEQAVSKQELRLMCSSVTQTSKSWVLVLDPLINMSSVSNSHTVQFKNLEFILIKG
jgi:hypothetical protein